MSGQSKPSAPRGPLTSEQAFNRWLDAAPKIPLESAWIDRQVTLTLTCDDWLIAAEISIRTGKTIGFLLSEVIRTSDGLNETLREARDAETKEAATQ